MTPENSTNTPALGIGRAVFGLALIAVSVYVVMAAGDMVGALGFVLLIAIAAGIVLIAPTAVLLAARGVRSIKRRR